MRATLLPLDGGQPIDIVKDVTVVGRKEFCDVRLNHASVSKVHLVLVKTDGLLLFRDLGSTNGTKVNGQQVIRGALLPNDKLNIAACKFRVQMLPDDAAAEHSNTDQTGAAANESRPVRVIRAEDLAHPDSAPDRPEPREGTEGPSDLPVGDELASPTPHRLDDDDGNAAPLFVD